MTEPDPREVAAAIGRLTGQEDMADDGSKLRVTIGPDAAGGS